MAAPVFDAASHAQAAGVPSVTWSHTCTGLNRYLAVGASTDWADNIIDVTYNGVACTKLTDASLGSGPIRAEYWYLINPASGTHDVVLTFNSSTSGRCGAASFTGVHQTTFHGTPATATGTSNTVSVVAVSSVTDQIVLDVAAVSGFGFGLNVGAGQTARVNQETLPMHLGMSTEAGAASVTMSWTTSDASSNAWATIAVALIGITAGSPGIILPISVEVDAEVGIPTLANLGDFPPPAPGIPTTLLIQGIDRSTNLRAVQSLDLEYTLGARGIARCEVFDTQANTETAFRPTVDQSLTLSRNAVTLFNGNILSVEDAAIAEPRRGVLTAIGAADFHRATTQRVISATYAAGNLLKGVVNHIVTTWLSIFNITLDPGMLDGPLLSEQRFDLVTAEAALNHLSNITGWIWRITPSRVLEMFAPGTKVAPFTLSGANANIRGGVRWSKTRGKYVNRVYVRFGTETQVEKQDTFFVTDPIQAFALTYPEKVADRGYITVNGIVVPIGPGTNWVITRTQLLAVTAPSPGDVIVVDYTVQFPIVIERNDIAEINSYGAYEEVVDLPDSFDIFTAAQHAAAVLRQYKAVPRTIRVRTRAGFVQPGTTIPISLPERTVTGNWLVTSVTIRDEIDRALVYDYTCLEGTEAQASWLEFWRQALGTPSQNKVMAGQVSGVVIPPLSGNFNHPISAVGLPNAWAANFMAGFEPGQSYGIRIQGGTNSTDSALRIVDSPEDVVLLLVRGDGLILASTQVTGGAGPGDVVIKNGADLRSVNGAGTGTLSLMEMNSSNQVVVAPEGQDIRWGRPAITLGGGATATLGTIGGSGPDVETQAGWLRAVASSGQVIMLPFWTLG